MALDSKARFAERVRLAKVLLARPVEDIRAVAQQQRDAYAAKVDKILAIGPGNRQYKEQLREIDLLLRRGDDAAALDSTDAATQRKRDYLNAFLTARTWADLIDTDFAQLEPALLTLTGGIAWLAEGAEATVDYAKPLIKPVIEAAGKAVGDLGSGLETVLLVLAGGLALGAVAYGYSRGGRGSRARDRYGY